MAAHSSPRNSLAPLSPECSSCSFPNNCSACIDGYHLSAGKCLIEPYSQCVQNIYVHEQICKEYCHKKCKTCNQTRTECIESAAAYIMSQGECVEKNQLLTLAQRIMPFLSFIKRRESSRCSWLSMTCGYITTTECTTMEPH